MMRRFSRLRCRSQGTPVSATYTFSKAIDEGQDFTSTAANRDLLSDEVNPSTIR